jgi:hypothetical protein
MVMQEEHRGFILVRANAALRPVRGVETYIILHLKVFVLGGTSWLREREVVPGLGLEDVKVLV